MNCPGLQVSNICVIVHTSGKSLQCSLEGVSADEDSPTRRLYKARGNPSCSYFWVTTPTRPVFVPIQVPLPGNDFISFVIFRFYFYHRYLYNTCKVKRATALRELCEFSMIICAGLHSIIMITQLRPSFLLPLPFAFFLRVLPLTSCPCNSSFVFSIPSRYLTYLSYSFILSASIILKYSQYLRRFPVLTVRVRYLKK